MSKLNVPWHPVDNLYRHLDFISIIGKNYFMKKKFLVTSSIIAFSIAVSMAMVPDNDVLRVKDKRITTFQKMIRDAKKTKIIFVGEIHDVPEYHRLELEVIKALHESHAPIAIGLEMFRADSQKALDNWVDGGMSLEHFLPVYYDNWREGWPLYKDIFSYARKHRISMIGLNIPDEIAKTVARRGFTSLTKKEKKQLPPNISCDIDPTYMEFIKKAYAGHARTADKKFLNFCEAQMVWDKSMAWHLIEYLKKHPGKTVIVLAGVGHAWKRGIPEQVSRLSKFTSTVILPLIPDQVEPDSVTPEDADFVVIR
jgi:uncharacterized iron-regulated protein